MREPSTLFAFKKTSVRYTTAVVLGALALLLARALKPFLGEFAPFVAAVPALAVATWRCGFGPSLASLALILLGANYWFLAPLHSLGIGDLPEAIPILICVVACGVLLGVGEASRRQNERLLDAQQELEEKVKQRTAQLGQANQSLSDLTSRLLKLQDDERRRIARDLHDSVGQTLTVLGVNLSNMETEIERLTKTVDTVRSCREIVRETSASLRTMSYLLHPPLLDENGLSSALPWYTQGFAERSGIQVELEIPEDFGRLSQDSEVAVFRVVQESLTNIHRHSGAKRARIRIKRTDGDICVRIEDNGKGIPADKLRDLASGGAPGVGIRGMRERIRQLGGSLEIDSKGLGQGAVILVRVPSRVAEATNETAASPDETAILPPPGTGDDANEGQKPDNEDSPKLAANAG